MYTELGKQDSEETFRDEKALFQKLGYFEWVKKNQLQNHTKALVLV